MIVFDSPNKRKRVGQISTIVIHYTEIDWQSTKKRFLDNREEVSAHLVIDQDGTVYRFVQDEDVAYHAGESCWYGIKGVNEYSIGIELVHSGFNPTRGIKVKGDEHLWASYDGRQIDTLVKLCKDYSVRYEIIPENIVGHSDIAPWRYNRQGEIYAAKQDPGPLFPWRHLYNQGIGRWYNIANQDHTACNFCIYKDDKSLSIALNQLGYHVKNDSKTIQLALRAFQMHYRPCDIRGIADQETLAIMTAMSKIDTV